ncbi:hypothetical protein GCM10020295_39490 [Streptomyces cinereospinus]
MSTKDFIEKDYYKVLGVPKDATEAEIKKAYRKLAREFHPDANKGNVKAEERFKEISEANDILGDPKKRKEYDEARALFGNGGFGPGPGAGGGTFNFDLGDLFGGAQGEGRRAAASAADSVTSSGACSTGAARPAPGPSRGAARTSSPRSPSASPRRSRARPSRCACPRRRRARPAPAPATPTAPRGCARPASAPARWRAAPAAASRSPTRARTARAAVCWRRTPARSARAAAAPSRRGPCRCASRPGSRTASGSGCAARARPASGAARRATCTWSSTSRSIRSSGARGDNLVVVVPVTFAEAALGGEVKVPTLGGPPVTLKLPPGTPNGRTMRARGKGAVRKDGTRGDLLVTVEVSVPTDLTGKARDALETYREATAGEDPRAELFQAAKGA